MAIFSFFTKSNDDSSLGIDIGTSSLKAVEISGGKEITLENYGEVFMRDFLGQVPVKGAEGSLIYSSKEIAEAVKYLLEEAGIKNRRAYFSIPDFVSFFTSFTVPKMKKEEINSAIEFHAKQYIPLPISEVALDWFLEEEKEKTKVNLIAVPNEVIDQYREIARLAQIEIISLEGEMFALVRALVRDVEKPTAIIDIGEQSTLLTIAEKGILKTTHSLEIAGNMLVKQVAKHTEIEYNAAKDIVMNYGVSEDIVKKAVSSPLTSLFSEVSRVIDAFEKKETKVIDEVIVAGGFSLLPGVVEFAEDALDKKVIRKSCFEGIIYPKTLEEELTRLSNSHSIALGVALNGIIKEEK
jgi:type IV pilus assembly protein PilM